jgi:predicted nucleic acid-binding protein
MPIAIIYWDTDAFLGWFQNESGKAELCEGTLQRAEKGEAAIVTSALTLAEMVWQRGAPKLPDSKKEIIRKFFRRSHIRVHNVTRAIAEQAQDLVWKDSVKPKDAIHISTALYLKVAAVETFDEDLLKKSGTIGDPPIIIRKPAAPVQGRLKL